MVMIVGFSMPLDITNNQPNIYDFLTLFTGIETNTAINILFIAVVLIDIRHNQQIVSDTTDTNKILSDLLTFIIIKLNNIRRF